MNRFAVEAGAIIVGGLLGLVVCVSAILSSATGSTDPDTYRLPACQVEDQQNCLGDAQTFGNHRGTDWVNINGVLYRKVGNQS